jgi:replicative DNA helicase
MTDDARLSGALQENLLTLLCFDDQNCKIARGALTPQLFESSVFKEVAGIAIDFIDQYGVAVKDHLPDHLEGVLNGDDKRKADSYRKLVDNLFAAKDAVNGEYVLSQLNKFVRQQNIKAALIKAVEAVEAGQIELAEVELQKGLNNQALSFEAGLNLSSPADVMSVLDSPEEEGFTLGIEELDRHGIIPRRKELFSFLAPRGRGKSWFITHCAKQALLQRWSVVIITLEMSEKRYAARMLQSFFSISRRDASVKLTRLVKDHNGQLQDLLEERIVRTTMRDDNVKDVVARRAKREFRQRPPLRIKEYATGSLTLTGVRAYLDGLERFEKFTPDLICIDYPKLMTLDSKNLRLELGALNEGIRGLGKERNAAVVIVAQGNRESETAKLVTGDMTSEDISLLATSDTFITYSQTLEEKKLGLARIFVEKSRNEESKMIALITQSYALGQFCLDSAALNSDYTAMMVGALDPAKSNKPQQRSRTHD